MRSRIIGLLAVFSPFVVAGPVRHQGRLVQHNRFPRFYNVSMTPSTTDDLQTSTPLSLPSPSLTSSVNALSAVGNTLMSTSAEDTLSAALSLSGSSIAASRSFPVAATTQSDAPSITSTLLSGPTTSSAVAPSVSSTPESVTFTSVTSGDSVGFQLSTSTQSSASSQQASSQDPSLSASSAVPAKTPTEPADKAQSETSALPRPTLTFKKNEVQLGTSNFAEFASVTAASNSPTPTPSGMQYPTAEEGSTAMAKGFNRIYKSLDVTSKCNANDNNQAFSCIYGELAQCQSDGTYVLKSCPDGQSCFALPNSAGSAGVSVECAVPSDAAAKLSGASESSSIATSQVAPISQASITQSFGGSQSTSMALPKTESVQIPVQRISSVSQSAQSSLQATSISQPAMAQMSGEAQEASSKMTQTESGQSPAQGTSSVQQAMAIPYSQTQSFCSLPSSVVSTARQTGDSQPSTERHTPTALADAEPSSSSQIQTVQKTVQTLSSLSPAQATANSQTEASPSPSNAFSSALTRVEGSSAHHLAASETATVASTAITAMGGPLFSVPILTPSSTQTAEAEHVQSGASSTTSVEAMSTVARIPPILAQQQAAPTGTLSAVPPDSANAAPSTPASSDDDGGIKIIPVEPQPTRSAPVINQKLAVEKPNANAEPSPSPAPSYGTPIYITVTVTTTAYGHSPSP